VDSIASELDGAMLIVTTAADGERSGCLVGFHTQCSINPMRWAVWISKTNHTFAVARRASRLAVHFPSEDDRDLAALFGSATGDAVDKFAQCAWTEGPGGMPLLDRIPTRFVGEHVSRFDDGGDHECFVVDVHDFEHARPLRPLCYRSVRDFHAGHAP
jgi:flavin reductase (DIM6/NTAB) family NADH-FMN oxidoreductase RutF